MPWGWHGYFCLGDQGSLLSRGGMGQESGRQEMMAWSVYTSGGTTAFAGDGPVQRGPRGSARGGYEALGEPAVAVAQ